MLLAQKSQMRLAQEVLSRFVLWLIPGKELSIIMQRAHCLTGIAVAIKSAHSAR
jgi:hypothetical protein